MTQLIYHDPSIAPGSASAFDRAIMEVVAGQSVLIACPYLNQTILQRILERSGKEWRLLTDIEELFRSLTVSSRNQFEAFISENRKNVRHVSRLHAKVIIAGGSAVVGSANFTLSGITQQTEMAVVLTSGETVEELRKWFNVLWERSAKLGRANWQCS
jgi:phosphatidylserine/phosphatidylglycerophosphate/cardiolipin synthase-like enzyme